LKKNKKLQSVTGTLYQPALQRVQSFSGSINTKVEDWVTNIKGLLV